MKIQIGVIGPDENENKNIEKLKEIAENLGKLIAENDAILVTGGCGGIMEAASKGAKNAGGIVVGTPGRTRGMSNKYVDIEILTPIDVGDFIFAGNLTSDVLIVVGDSAGTLAELTLAYRMKKPIIIIKELSTYDNYIDGYIDEGESVKILGAENAEEAIKKAIDIAKTNIGLI